MLKLDKESAIKIVDLADYNEKLQIQHCFHDLLMKELVLKTSLLICLEDFENIFPTEKLLIHTETEEFMSLLTGVEGLLCKQLQLSEFYDLAMYLINKYLEKVPWCDPTELLKCLIREIDYIIM